jgi:hypothetical protein
MTRMSLCVILALAVSCTLGLPRNDKHDDVSGQHSYSIFPLLSGSAPRIVALTVDRKQSPEGKDVASRDGCSYPCYCGYCDNRGNCC